MMTSKNSSQSEVFDGPGSDSKPFIENYTKPEAVEKCKISEKKWKPKVTFNTKEDGYRNSDRVIIFIFVAILLAVVLAILLFFSSASSETNSEPEGQTANSSEMFTTTSVTPLLFKSSLTRGHRTDEPTSLITEANTDTTEPTTITTDLTEDPTEESTTEIIETDAEEVTHPFEFHENKENTETESCMSNYARGASSGIYDIVKGDAKFKAPCDMETANGGWTIIQRRINQNIKFHKLGWEQYKNGFGNLEENFWLGLKNIYALAPDTEPYVTLRIELRGDTCSDRGCFQQPDGFWFGEWQFRISNESDGYRLDISTALKGNLTSPGNKEDPFYAKNNGQMFTTLDRDLDRMISANCAQFRNYGPWWHSDCTNVALNGLNVDDTKNLPRYLVWSIDEPKVVGRLGHIKSIHPKMTTMMIRPFF